MQSDIDMQKVLSSLQSLALGLTTKEVVEDFTFDGENLTQKSKKVVTKTLPPDLSAIKLLLSLPSENYQDLTPEELEAEKQKLLNLLAENKKEEI